jgi:hypothetical protein
MQIRALAAARERIREIVVAFNEDEARSCR